MKGGIKMSDKTFYKGDIAKIILEVNKARLKELKKHCKKTKKEIQVGAADISNALLRIVVNNSKLYFTSSELKSIIDATVEDRKQELGCSANHRYMEGVALCWIRNDLYCKFGIPLLF